MKTDNKDKTTLNDKKVADEMIDRYSGVAIDVADNGKNVKQDAEQYTHILNDNPASRGWG